MIRFKTTYVIIAISILFIARPALSTTFCVTTSAELESALDTADQNSQSDLIKIATGAYIVPKNGFSYLGSSVNSNELFDIEISGGWGFFLGNPCGRKADVSPFATKLDGDFKEHIFYISTAPNTKTVISNLLFINANGAHSRAAITIYSDSNADILIEKNAFINNTSVTTSALSINADETYTANINNNLFASNHSITVGTITIGVHNNDRLFFINNTVVNNTTDSLEVESSAGIYIIGSGQSLLANNILWGNDLRDIRYNVFLGLHYLEHNNIEFFDGTVDIEFGNISVSPAFESGILNYNLSSSSQLINAGLAPPNVINVPPLLDETWSLSSTDMLGESRLQSNQVDMGAYESSYDYTDVIFENDFD